MTPQWPKQSTSGTGDGLSSCRGSRASSGTRAAFDPDSRDGLFAHCVALSANAVYEPWNRRTHALAHADRIAEAIGLDVAAAGWSPTVDNYLGRVTKARILQAVREARGETASAQRAAEEG